MQNSFRNQFPKNLISNVLYFLVNVIIGILLVPFFIDSLGVAAYGLIPMATSVTGYVAIVVQSLNTAVSRFLTVDLQKGNFEAANRTFNTALFGITAVILAMVPIVIIVAWFVPSWFNVPEGQTFGTVLLFLGVFSAFLIRAWSGNFTVQLFAFNRLDLQNSVNLTNLIVQTVFIVLFFVIFGPDLALVGAAYFIGAVFSSVLSVHYARQVCPELKISIGLFDRARIRDLGGMGWWVVINQIGSLLFLQIDLIVVNIIFGSLPAGEYAVALQWATVLRAISGVLAGVLTPMVLSYYARGHIDTLINVSRSAVKVLGLVMALPIGLICGFAPQLLTAWVGEEFVHLAPLMVLLTVHLAVNLAVRPLFSINVAFNKVRIPGMVTLIMGIANFALAVVLSLYTDWGFYGVAAAGAIVLTFKNALFTPWYATRVLGVSAHTFTRSMVPGIIAMAMLVLIATALSSMIPNTSMFLTIIAGGSVAIMYLIVAWFFTLSDFERDLFSSFIPKRRSAQ